MSNTSHLGGTALVGDPMTHMPDVWEKLVAKYPIHSVLDIGSGVGVNAKWFYDLGHDVFAIEGFPDYLANAVLPAGRMIAHDYTKGPYIPEGVFDLGWSSEFVEHVEEQFVPNFMATFKRCRFVCMTHATPGQGGYHHVNEQPSGYWIEKMREAGFTHLEHDSQWMQATGPDTHYGRRTLMLFRNDHL
jgi:SAM-dependent methyltransferase